MKPRVRVVRSLAVGLGLLLSACPGSSDPSSGAAGGPRRGVTIERQVVAPTESPTRGYSAPVRHELSAVEQAILATIEPSGARHDPALSALVRELAARTPDRFNVPPALVEGLLSWFGLVDPPPGLVVVELEGSCADLRSCAEPARALAESFVATPSVKPGATVGVGVATTSDGRTRMMIGYLDRGVSVEPIEKTIPSGGSVTLDGVLIGGRTKPRIDVIDARGAHHQPPVVVGSDGSFSTKVACAYGNGTYQVEVLAEGKHGTEVVANFPVYCGTQRPSSIKVEIERLNARVDAASVARSNFDFLNEERESRGLPALAWDAEVATIARAHSADMKNNGFVGHVSPTTGGVMERFKAARVNGPVVRENVARGYGPKGIHESLMSSPGHRVNMLATDVTHVGIGVVIGSAESTSSRAPRPIFLTQNFYRKPGHGVPKDLPATVRRGIDERRAKKGLPPLPWDDQVAKLAQDRADAVANGRPGLGDAEFQRQIYGLGYQSIERQRFMVSDHIAITTLDDVWLAPDQGRTVGFGVAQIPARRPDGGNFILVVIRVSA